MAMNNTEEQQSSLLVQQPKEENQETIDEKKRVHDENEASLTSQEEDERVSNGEEVTNHEKEEPTKENDSVVVVSSGEQEQATSETVVDEKSTGEQQAQKASTQTEKQPLLSEQQTEKEEPPSKISEKEPSEKIAQPLSISEQMPSITSRKEEKEVVDIVSQVVRKQESLVPNETTTNSEKDLKETVITTTEATSIDGNGKTRMEQKEELGDKPFNFEGIPTEISARVKFPPLNEQAKDIGGGIYRKTYYTEKLLLKKYEDISTCYDSFQRSAIKNASKPCLGYRPILNDGQVSPTFNFFSYEEVKKRVDHIGSAMRSLLKLEPKQHIGIYSKNKIEWQLVSEACHTQSIVSIALYDSLGEDSSLHILNHGEIVAVFCGDITIANRILKMADQCQHLKHVIYFNNHNESASSLKKECQREINVYSFSELEEYGAKLEKQVDHVPPSPNDLATIMYTSGTTGLPKGVMLTHYNVLAAVCGAATNFFELNDRDVILSYLPLAHILERVAELLFLQTGGSIGFWQGDVTQIANDIAALKPTVLPAVPRVLDRFYGLVKTQVESGGFVKKYLFNKAFIAKKRAQETGKTTPIWDKIVFNKTKAKLGGRIRGILSGGAPLRPEVQEYLRVVFDCPIIQGYGLTETCAAATIQLPFDFTTGHIGSPLACNEIRLESVPEMNYFADGNPPSGEICVRGPNVFVGYYKAPELTAEVFDNDGWFHTGDIGQINPNGSIKIIDRKKNIFKLSQGEYIAAENLEQKLALCPFLSKIWVYGDSYKNCLVAVGVVEQNTLIQYLKQNPQVLSDPTIPEISVQNIEQIIRHSSINQFILKDLERVCKELKLQGYEYIKAIHLVHFDFETIHCVTPTMKLQRAALKKHFQKELDEMYAGLESAKK